MGKGKSDILQGTLALLVLKTLQQGPMHGRGITLRIHKISKEVLRVEAGSLYPAPTAWSRTGGLRPNGESPTTTAARAITG